MRLFLYPPQSVSVAVPPLEYFLDGVETPVSQDTATPANSKPLPVIQLDSTGNIASPLTDTQLRATPVPVSGPLTDTELRATPVPVSGTVTANTGLSQPLTDTQLRATAVAVSGPLTDAELRATPVPISGTVTANTGLSQPLTDAELRATAVPVSGPLTDAQLRATPVPVSGSVTATGSALETTQVANGVLIGAVDETSPVSDTANSGLNGRLQRIAQRITSLIDLLPVSLGQKTGAGSLSFVLASDQAPISVTPTVQALDIYTTQKAVGVAAVRATVDDNAPVASRIKLILKPSADNAGRIYFGPAGVTTANGMEIIGPDRVELDLDAADYYLISDTADQVVEILEKY